MNREQLEVLADLKEAFADAEDTCIYFEAKIAYDDTTAESDYVLLESICANDGRDRVDVLGNAVIRIQKDNLVKAMQPYLQEGERKCLKRG